jgi:hypothetical protein
LTVAAAEALFPQGTNFNVLEETGAPQDLTAFGTSSIFGLPIQFASDVDVVPAPAALPLFATGLGALGLLGWRRKKTAAG